MNIAITSVIVCVAICLPCPGLGWGGYGGGAAPSFFPVEPVQPTQDFPVDQSPFAPGFPTYSGRPAGFPIIPSGRPQRPSGNMRPQNKRPNRGGRANQCQKFANRGSCRFYNCFKKIESDCLAKGDFLIENLEVFCLNTKPLIKKGAFSAWGKKYINRVRQCQNRLLAGFVKNQNCDAINNQASLAFLGTETGNVGPQDCYWQNEQFCEAIGNVNDNAALVQSVFGDDDGGFDEAQISLGQHFQYLATFCPQAAQNVFQENFVNQCPPGTIQAIPTPPPMMMMGGNGGD